MAGTAKKTAAKNEPKDAPEDTPDEATGEDDEQGVRENNPAGVHDALKGPSTSDLNPAFK